jgi:hypothetical protein
MAIRLISDVMIEDDNARCRSLKGWGDGSGRASLCRRRPSVASPVARRCLHPLLSFIVIPDVDERELYGVGPHIAERLAGCPTLGEDLEEAGEGMHHSPDGT